MSRLPQIARDPVSLVAILVIIVSSTMALGGALESGVTLDEPTQLSRTGSWLSEGWFVPANDLVDGEPRVSPYIYGPAASSSAHLINALAGHEPWGATSNSTTAWQTRHLVTVFFGLAAALATALATTSITGSRRAGLWSAAALTAIPIWIGMSYFNIKDVPVATGYTLVTAGLVLALGPEAGRAVRARLSGVAVLVAVGAFLSVGTRIAIWVPLLASLALYATMFFARHRYSSQKPDTALPAAVAAGCVVALVSLIAIYPKVFTHPVSALANSVSDSADYPWEGFTLTAGRLLTEYPPAWYLPAWLTAAVPTLLLLLAVAGAICGLFSLLRSSPGPGSRLRSLVERPGLPIILVLAQVLLLPLASIVTGANIYSGLRQHLYMVPALAILAGIGAHQILTASREKRSESPGGPRRWLYPLAAAVVSMALLAPMVSQIRLFPYGYTYVSPVAGIGGINDRWETDFWWASFPEAISTVPEGEPIFCSSLIPAGKSADGLTFYRECPPELTDPFEAGRGSDAAEVIGEGTWVVAARRAGNKVPEYCREVDRTTRSLRGEQVVMAYILRCDSKRVERLTID